MYDNPAQQLLDFVLRFETANRGVAASDGWRLGADLDPSASLSDLLVCAAAISLLPVKIKQDLQGVDDEEKAMLLTWDEAVLQLLSTAQTMGATTVEGALTRMDAEAKLSLRMTALKLRSVHGPAPVVDLDSVSQHVRQLRDELDSVTSLDSDLREFLLRLIEEMHCAIRTFQATGLTGMARAYEQSAGAIALRFGPTAQNIPPGPGKTFVSKFLVCLGIYGGVVAAAHGTYQLAADVGMLSIESSTSEPQTAIKGDVITPDANSDSSAESGGN